MNKPRFQMGTMWPDKTISWQAKTGDAFMFPDNEYGHAALYDGEDLVLEFSIDDGSKRCNGRKTLIRII